MTVKLRKWSPLIWPLGISLTVKASEGYCFFGKFAFLCYGPVSEYFSKTLLSKGSQVTKLEDKNKMDIAAMLKETSAQADVNHDVGGSDCGMSIATKASFGIMHRMKMMLYSIITTCVGPLLLN